ncbi:MAG: hypothetical protein R6V85_09355 [Polyangia bacterium]
MRFFGIEELDRDCLKRICERVGKPRLERARRAFESVAAETRKGEIEL